MNIPTFFCHFTFAAPPYSPFLPRTNNIDIDLCREKGIAVANAGPYSTTAVIQHTFNLALALMGNASHELKTPLTSISTSADVLHMEDKDNEWVENIRNQAKRMTVLVQNMTLLAGLDEETAPGRTEEFDFSETAWEGIEVFGSAAKARNCTFSPDIEEGNVFKGDPQLIQKLFSVLFENAVRYCDEGGSIRILVKQTGKKQRGRTVCIETGNPCTNHKITEPDRLFDRFYRPDHSRSSDTGNFGIPMLIICFYPLLFSMFGEVYLPTSYGSILAFFFMGLWLIAVGMSETMYIVEGSSS